jgi:hypothetical protein
VLFVLLAAQVWDKLCLSSEERVAMLGPLVGTHAHEMSMALQQLCSTFDQQGQGSGQVGEGRRLLHSTCLGWPAPLNLFRRGCVLLQLQLQQCMVPCPGLPQHAITELDCGSRLWVITDGTCRQ